MSCNDNPAATGGDEDLSPITVIVMLTMLTMFLHHLLPRARVREAKNVTRLADDTAEQLSADEVAIIFGYLPHQDIMRVRRVCTTWRDAAKKTVPSSKFVVDSLRSYNTMRVMATALPTLQHLLLRRPSGLDMNTCGEDPDEVLAQPQRTANANFIIMSIISNFRKLRVLEIDGFLLNGRYPSSFIFPNLQSLTITHCHNFKLGLDMLASFPLLKELKMRVNQHLTGNLRSLRVLKDTLEKVEINNCRKIEGNFMDLADFPCLTDLYLLDTAVTGDIRDIGEHDFPALECLSLPRTVHGGRGYKFQRITDVPDFMHTIHILLQRTPTLFREIWLSRAFVWSLSEDSPDWYAEGIGNQSLPFALQLIRVGSRLGWSWCSKNLQTRNPRHSCEINWLDPEPSSESDDYEAYIEALQRIEGEMNTDFYRGYHEPPTEMEYRRLCEGLEQRD